jgi:hypothetical protein
MNYRKINGLAALLKPTTAAQKMITTTTSTNLNNDNNKTKTTTTTSTSATITANTKKLHLNVV